MSNTKLRAASLQDLVTVLTEQDGKKLDVIAPAEKVTSQDGVIVVQGTEPTLTPDGVTNSDGYYRPTEVFLEGLSNKLGIPPMYLKRMHTERPDIFDANINGWLRGGDQHDADSRAFMLRLFRGDNDTGVARAFVSDKFAIFDSLDFVTASLSGIQDAGVPVNIHNANLTDRGMQVMVSAPQVQALAPKLLAGYRSPFTGEQGADNPLVFAGFRITNSEVGAGSANLTPEITVQVCNNGMTITKQAMRTVHLGGRQEEGVVQWSHDTNQKNLDLIKARTRDAVATFLTREFVEAQVAELEEAASKPVTDAAPTVERVTKALLFTKAEQQGVLDHFIKGGQMTSGGVMQAVTSFAQTVQDADRAQKVQESGVRAMTLV